MLAGANRVGDPTKPGVPQDAPDPRAASQAALRLLAHRRAQRGSPAFGDAADAAFVDALAGLAAPLPPALALALDRTGEEMGRHVYAKRVLDDSLRDALLVLSDGLHASGLGSLLVEDVFHRSARVRLAPARPVPAAAQAYVAGVLRGFLSEAMNCGAHVRPAPDGALEVRLDGGRDVNRREEVP